MRAIGVSTQLGLAVREHGRSYQGLVLQLSLIPWHTQ